jgi:galactokinase
VEFGQPGGMMDQYSTAMGGLIYLESEPNITLISLKPIPVAFVLGDSLEQKNTLNILQRCKNNRLDISNKLKNDNPEFSLHSIKITDIVNFTKILTKNEMELLRGTVTNRDILRKALSVLQSENPDYELIGNLLTDHHAVLRNILKVSTPKIEAMLESALKAGALGGKINGSGGGGCMFAIASGNPQAVAEAIEKVGGEATIIRQIEGTKIGF